MNINKRNLLEILTIVLIFVSIFLFETCYCNFIAISEKTYNFSTFRIIVYIIFMVLYKLFADKFIDQALETLKSKKKILISYFIISIILVIYFFKSSMNMYYTFIGLMAVINGFIFILYITKDYIKNIIVTTITLGFIFSLTTTAFHIVDEKKHFMSALNLADGNLDLQKPVTEKVFDEIEFNTYMRNFAVKYFGEKYTQNITKIDENESVYSTPADNPIITYLPSAIGINIARALGGSVGDIFVAGRIANLIAFSILLIIIFKLLPFKRDTFYSIYLLPMILVLAGTYSVDGITVGLVGVFIAYVLKLYKEKNEDINIKQFIILICLFLLSLLCKSGVYFGIGLIIFILPIFKIIKKDKKILSLIFILVLVALSLGIYKGSNIVNNTTGDVRVNNTSPVKQMQFLFENPVNIVKVYTNYIRESLLNLNWYTGFNLKVFFGNEYSSILFLLFIFVLYTAITDSSYTFKNKEKLVAILTFSSVFVISTFVLYLAYTKVGKLTIGGYQARYIIAIVPLILMNINSKKISQNYINNDSYNKTSLFIGIFTFMDLMSRIII